MECGVGVGVGVAGSSIAFTYAVAWQFAGRRCRCRRRRRRLVSERLGVSSSQQVRRTKTVSHVQAEMRVSHARGKH